MNNRYEIRENAAVIFLERKNGDLIEALIDISDLELADSFQGKWCFAQVGINHAYVSGTIYDKGKYRTLKLHRLLMNPKEDMYIDHINHNGLDNRRINLREVTNAENQQNRTNMPGVDYVPTRKSDKKWRARVRTKKKLLYCDYFLTREEAERETARERKRLFPFSKEAAV